MLGPWDTETNKTRYHLQDAEFTGRETKYPFVVHMISSGMKTFTVHCGDKEGV